MRPFFLLAVAFGLASAASAQPQPPEIPVTKLTVKAAASPIPALRYELLPSFRDQSPGNAAITYHRAMLMLGEIRSASPKEQRERDSKIDEMYSKPVKEVDAKVLRDYLQSYNRILRELETGAKRDKCDWDLERRLDADGIGVLLPEVQKMREMARLLNIRCQMHCAEGKFEDALRDVQIGFAMSRQVGEGSTLIQALVGMAISAIFSNRLEHILEMPDCPNLYWSLTALPRPFFDMHKPMEGEVRMLEASLPLFCDVEKPMTVEQVQRMLDGWAKSLNQFAGNEANVLTSRLAMAALVSTQHASCKKTLLKMGKTEAELDAMPAGQVVLLDAVLQFKSLRDELFVWFHIPYHESIQGVQRAMKKVREIKVDAPGHIFQSLLILSLPGVEKIHFAAVRTERKIAALRTIEALRMHAAANNNTFPATLKELTAAPVPMDPVTGKFFDYELTKDGRALLSAPAPQGQQANQGNTVKYELTLVK